MLEAPSSPAAPEAMHARAHAPAGSLRTSVSPGLLLGFGVHLPHSTDTEREKVLKAMEQSAKHVGTLLQKQLFRKNVPAFKKYICGFSNLPKS